MRRMTMRKGAALLATAMLTSCNLPEVGLAKNPTMSSAYDEAPYVLRFGVFNLSNAPVTRTVKVHFVFQTTNVGKTVNGAVCGFTLVGYVCDHKVTRDVSSVFTDVPPGNSTYAEQTVGGTAPDERCVRGTDRTRDCTGTATLTMTDPQGKQQSQTVSWSTKDNKPYVFDIS
ncbi:hypothetical protein [Sphingomonas endolithica]|uniref:hypothetical protein n=1 Tax=Sphingomonas endolithica TaxID=2972485 RepID=UPI0021AF716C|nr:hypothetical protein [Sphingomonas sp. ZFBP2030]